MHRICVLVSLCALALACGDNNRECGEGTRNENGRCVPVSTVTCGEGTFEYMGECVPYDPSDTQAPTTTASPDGGVYVELPGFVVLTSDEPAEIHYTTDGSDPDTNSTSELSPVFILDVDDGTEIKFFAVDPAGNSESVKTELYQLDTNVPLPVDNFTASDDGSSAALSWTNPVTPDLAGVLITRSAGVVGQFAPEAAETYSEGQMVAPGEEVVFVGAGTSANDTNVVTGFNGYHIWAFDEAGNFSTLRSASVVRMEGDQIGTLSVDLGSEAVTVTQPADMSLAATAVYDDGADTVTISLTIDNELARVAHNIKAVVTGVTGGSLSNPDGQIGGDDYVYFGPNSLAPMGSATRDLVITGVDGSTDPVVVDIQVRNDPLLITGTHFTTGVGALLVDAGAMTQVGTVACDDYKYTFNSNNFCSWRRGVVSPSGRYLYIGSRHNTVVRTVDLTTMETVAAITLAPFGFVEGVVWAGDYLYAVLNTTTHAFPRSDGADPKRSADGGVFLVKLEANGSMVSEANRLVLVANALAADRKAGRPAAISADNSTAAVPINNSGEVVLVDLDSFDLIDTDSVTAGVQNLDVSSVGANPVSVAFSADGSELYIGYSRNTNTDTITTVQMSDFTTGALTTTIANIEGTSDLTVDGSGRLWASRVNSDANDGGSISVYDTSGTETDTLITMANPPNLGGARIKYADVVGFSADGSLAYVPFFVTNASANEDPQIAIFDTTTLERVDIDGAAGNGITNIALDRSNGAHVLIVTPF